MEYADLRAGLVVAADWDDRPFRILAFDRIEVLYDCWWPHAGAWGFSDLTGTGHYYRTSTQLVLARATALRLDPLTEAEGAVHRPDLPLRLLRFAELEWNDAVTSSIEAFSSWLSASAPALSLSQRDVALDAAAVELAPYGPKGGMRKPVLVGAGNGKDFPPLELLWRAACLQAPIASKLRHGVGLYRLGFGRQRPLFYLWGYQDRAGLIARVEADG